MFSPALIRVLSMIACLVCLAGAAIQVFVAIKVNPIYYLGLASWVLLAWSGYIGFRLSFYKLYPDEYRKVAIRIMLVIVAAGIAFFTGYVIGIILSAIILATLWALKRNYDDWNYGETEPEVTSGEN